MTPLKVATERILARVIAAKTEVLEIGVPVEESHQVKVGANSR
jgi:hypothetical protein